MEIGQEFETKIISQTEHGDGISLKGNLILIIPGANIDQRVRVKILEKGVTKAVCEVMDYLD